MTNYKFTHLDEIYDNQFPCISKITTSDDTVATNQLVKATLKRLKKTNPDATEEDAYEVVYQNSDSSRRSWYTKGIQHLEVILMRNKHAHVKLKDQYVYEYSFIFKNELTDNQLLTLRDWTTSDKQWLRPHEYLYFHDEQHTALPRLYPINPEHIEVLHGPIYEFNCIPQVREVLLGIGRELTLSEKHLVSAFRNKYPERAAHMNSMEIYECATQKIVEQEQKRIAHELKKAKQLEKLRIKQEQANEKAIKRQNLSLARQLAFEQRKQEKKAQKLAIKEAKRQARIEEINTTGIYDMSPESLHKLFRYDNGSIYWIISMSNRAKIGDEAGCIVKPNRKRVAINGNSYFVHNIIWAMHYREWPPTTTSIEHIDGNTLNNKIENLKLKECKQ